jgi:hypothetical protein
MLHVRPWSHTLHTDCHTRAHTCRHEVIAEFCFIIGVKSAKRNGRISPQLADRVRVVAVAAEVAWGVTQDGHTESGFVILLQVTLHETAMHFAQATSLYLRDCKPTGLKQVNAGKVKSYLLWGEQRKPISRRFADLCMPAEACAW